jgi:error-prone DNA polymerase
MVYHLFSTARGVVFMTLEDETGIVNLILYPRVYDRYRKAARHATIAVARGTVQRQGQVVHVMVQRIDDINDALADLAAVSRDFH